MSSPLEPVHPNAFQQAFIRQPFAEASPGIYFQIIRVEQVAPHLLVPTLLHRTTFNYFVLLTQGEGRQLHNLDEVEIKAGTMLLVKADNITAIQQISPSVTGFFIGFDNPVFESLLSPLQLQQWYGLPAGLALSAKEQAWCGGVAELLLQEWNQARQTLTEPIRYLLAGFISKVLPKTQDLSGGFSRDQLLTIRFKKLLHQHARRQHQLSFYADTLTVSENYLFRCVKRVTGKAPKELLLETLLLHAMVQLSSSTLDINAISFSVGIEDPSYFGRLFKKHTGLTPTEYRQAIQQELPRQD